MKGVPKNSEPHYRAIHSIQRLPFQKRFLSRDLLSPLRPHADNQGVTAAGPFRHEAGGFPFRDRNVLSRDSGSGKIISVVIYQSRTYRLTIKRFMDSPCLLDIDRLADEVRGLPCSSCIVSERPPPLCWMLIGVRTWFSGLRINQFPYYAFSSFQPRPHQRFAKCQSFHLTLPLPVWIIILSSERKAVSSPSGDPGVA